MMTMIAKLLDERCITRACKIINYDGINGERKRAGNEETRFGVVDCSPRGLSKPVEVLSLEFRPRAPCQAIFDRVIFRGQPRIIRCGSDLTRLADETRRR